MRSKRTLLIGLIASGAAMAGNAGKDGVPLFFIENQGQAHSSIKFMSKGSGVTAWFSAQEAQFRMGGASVRMEYEGANPDARVEGVDALPSHANFLIGAREDWRMDVPTYRGIRYRDLYPGIDMTYGGSGRDFKSEFIVAPGVDTSRIRMRYFGTGDLRIEESGELVIPLNAGARKGEGQGARELREQAPTLYQEYNGQRVPVEGRFVLLDGRGVGFAVGKYDLARPLVIDPVLSYSTLLGGSGSDAVTALAVNSAGSAYVAGFTDSFDLPAASPEQNVNAGGNDVFVAKLNPSGNGLLYCTYLGGAGDDRAYGIAVDASGSAYIAGTTTSTNFPVRSPLQSTLGGGRNAFVAKLNAAGNVLVFSTYLGGNGSDTAYGVALDSTGNAYIVGDTTSTNFPSTGVQRTYHGAQDAFVSKLSADGSRLIYSTYLGGGSVEHGAAIAVDLSGSAYVTGSTFSADFPVANAFHAANAGGQDAFVTRLSADGNTLLFSTFFGGSGGTVGYPEAGLAIALDGQGNAYVTGVTSSQDFPGLHALQSTLRGFTDAFVSKMSASGALIYSTYLGGSGIEMGNAVVVGAGGSAYVAGYTYSTDLPVVNALQPALAGECDAFLARLSPAGDSLSYLSYLGGNHADTAAALALDPAGAVYIAGWTLSSNFPLLNAFQSTNAGNYGAFVTKMVLGTVAAPPVLSVTNTHTGSFTQGQNGAAYSITVSNGTAAGASSGTVTVTEFIPAGLTLASMAGTGWTCVSNSCTRSDALAGGTSYPAIAVTVTVAGNAGSPLVNQVSVTGGGSTGASANDSTTINANSSGAGSPDLIWQADSTRQVTVHYYGGAGGATFQGWNYLNAGGIAGWTVVAAADFDGNGVPDLVWMNNQTRQVTVHYYGGVGGATFLGWNWLNAGGVAGWTVVGAADFDGNGTPDLIWQNDATRQVTVHYYGGAGGATFQGWNFLNSGGIPGWTVVGAADFDGNGVPDLIWKNDATRQVTVHYFGGAGGATFQGWNWLNAGGIAGWTVAGASDFDGNGVPDLVWQSDSTRQVTVHYYGGAQGATFTGWQFLNSGGIPGWHVVVPH